jgi:hypothetical protein
MWSTHGRSVVAACALAVLAGEASVTPADAAAATISQAIQPAGTLRLLAGNTSSNTSSNTSNNSSSDGQWRRDRIIREERRDFQTDRGGYSSGYYLDHHSGHYWQDDRRRHGQRFRRDRDD